MEARKYPILAVQWHPEVLQLDVYISSPRIGLEGYNVLGDVHKDLLIFLVHPKRALCCKIS